MATTGAALRTLSYEDEVFCREMVMTGAILGAFRTAYADCRSDSDTHAYRKATAKLNSPRISERIGELRDAVAKKLVADKARVIEEIAGIALLDPLDVLDGQGALRPLVDIPRHARAAIKGIEFSTERYTETDEETGEQVTRFASVPSKIEFWPKTTALDQLSKHLGLYAADHAQRNQKPTWENLPREVRSVVMAELRKVATIGSPEPGKTVDQPTGTGPGESITH